MAAPTSWITGLWVVLLAITGGRPSALPKTVFPTDEPVLEGSPAALGSRSCLPADYLPREDEQAAAVATALLQCSERVSAGSQGDNCEGAPAVALLYVCMANSLGHLDAAGSAFDWSAFEGAMLAYTPEVTANWQLGDETQRVLLEGCLRSSDARLSPRQRAVFSFACWQWSVACECDKNQGLHNRVDAAGTLRYIGLLSGRCSLSPSQSLDGFGLVTGRTWTKCNHGLYTGDELEQRYAADSARVACLLQGFVNDKGYLDIARFRAVNDAESTGMFKHNWMDRVIRQCGMVPEGGSYMDKPLRLRYKTNLTLEEFIYCWAADGSVSCAYQEANRLALDFSESCSMSV